MIARTKSGHLTAASLKEGYVEKVGVAEIWYFTPSKVYVIQKPGARTEYNTRRKDVALQTARALG